MPKREIGLDAMERAAVALIEYRSLKEAARAAGVHPVTVWRWLKMPHFREQLREAQSQIYSQQIARLQLLASKAVTVLEELLNSPETPASTRFRVAEYVLDQSKRPFSIEDIRHDDSEPEEVPPVGISSGIKLNDNVRGRLKRGRMAQRIRFPLNNSLQGRQHLSTCEMHHSTAVRSLYYRHQTRQLHHCGSLRALLLT